MKFVRCFILFVMTMTNAHAAVISRDWKTPGDGLLTYDTVNKREWLDLNVQLSVTLPRYENVIAELGSGGVFEGFVVANQNDMTTLAESAGISTTTTDIEVNGVPTLALINLLRDSDGATISRGQIEETFALGPFFPHVGAEFFHTPHRSAGLRFLSYRTDAFPYSGLPVYLYGQVPEPATLFLPLAVIFIKGVMR